MGKRLTVKPFVLLTALLCITAAAYSDVSVSSDSDSTGAALVSGYEAYMNGDWNGATLFFKKAFTNPENGSAENRYMLIMSEMYSGNYNGVISECNDFTEEYSDSGMYPYVQYQKGRALYNLGQVDGAVLTLSDFCHQYPQNELYPSALYLIAECFYNDYSFDEARKLYETIVADYPESERFDDAQVRLETLGQKEREQKLLYLLKVTGEEYLSSKEDYERQLKQYQTEDLIVLRRQLNEANQRIAELEKAASESLAQAQAAQETLSRQEAEKKALEEEELKKKQEEISRLKEKANQIEVIMNYLNSGK